MAWPGTEWQPAQRRWRRGLGGWKSREADTEMERKKDQRQKQTQMEENTEER